MTTPRRLMISDAWDLFVDTLPLGLMRAYAAEIRPVRLDGGVIVMQSNDEQALAWAEARWTKSLERHFMRPVRWELASRIPEAK